MTAVTVMNERDPLLSETLRARGLDVITVRDKDELAAAMATCEGLYINPPGRVDLDLLAGAPALRVIAAGGAGLDHIDLQAASDAGVMVVNARGRGSSAVAEHTIGVMIAMAKRLLEADRLVREGDFASRWRLPLTELRGKTLGIVGYGNIGRAIAARANAFDMQVLRTPSRRPEPDDGLGLVISELHDLLAASDYVSINVPLSAETVDHIGAEELAAMRPGSFLVNTSRGGVVNEPALVEALERGHLAGAAVDVFSREPATADDPLLAAPNVLATPHYAGITEEAIRRMAEGVAHEIADALERPAT